MAARRPLPETIRSAPFAVAAALAAGVTEGRLRGVDLRVPFHGVRALGPVAPHPAVELLPKLRPGDRFSSVTALALRGAPLPRRFESAVHVTAGPGIERMRRVGVIGHDHDGRVPARFGSVPVSEPARAFIEAARLLRLEELVAVGDWLILEPRFAEPERPAARILDLVAASSDRAAGVRLARRAVALLRPGVESPAETRLRLLLVGAGLPEPICGFELLDARGRRIGWFDLAWPQHLVLGEYDGDQHRTSREQYDRDIRRFDLASDLDWRLIRVRASGLGQDAEDTVRRFRRALGLGARR
jgi:hypothetical protein